MFIQPFITKRINAQMQELTIQGAIALCEIPPHLNELGISRALEKIINQTNLPLKEWTVQERVLAIAHYLTAQEQGDFYITEQSKLSDFYLDQDYQETPYYFDDLEIVPLTAKYAESIERAIISMNIQNAWTIGAMAATIRQKGDKWQGSADEFIHENIQRILNLPESEFLELLNHFQAAQEHLKHGVEILYTNDGIAMLSQKGDTSVELVKFRFDTLINETTATLFRKPENISTNNRDTDET